MTENDLARHFPTLEPPLVAEMVKVADLTTFSEVEVLMHTGQEVVQLHRAYVETGNLEKALS
jgi:CRP/FNR family transcriptional regulator, anaerobic regulatory protein